ncbi:MAG TPA: ABC transporter permease [Azospirillaceae bacterium]|nr:ABC transporter permease [Azospirillaceae bacterium]
MVMTAQHEPVPLGAAPDYGLPEREPGQVRLALRDIAGGLARWPLWSLLALQDIRQRYRRSVLGPLWLTISMGVLVSALGLLYSGLFKQPVETFVPYLAAGFIVWGLVSALVSDGCQCLILAERTIRQIPLPLTVHVLRAVTANLIVAAHNALIFVAAALIFQVPVTAYTLLALPGLLLVLLNGLWISMALGMICARFRDVPQIVGSVLQLGMFLTPVFWTLDALPPDRLALALWNPFFHLLQVVRAPLLGGAPEAMSWWVAGGMAAAGLAATFALFVRCRRRIAYWV